MMAGLPESPTSRTGKNIFSRQRSSCWSRTRTKTHGYYCFRSRKLIRMDSPIITARSAGIISATGARSGNDGAFPVRYQHLVWLTGARCDSGRIGRRKLRPQRAGIYRGQHPGEYRTASDRAARACLRSDAPQAGAPVEAVRRENAARFERRTCRRRHSRTRTLFSTSIQACATLWATRSAGSPGREGERNAFGPIRPEKDGRMVPGGGCDRCVVSPPSVGPGVSTHAFGGTRMGSNPENNVVDQWGFSHEAPNLGF